ncbi:hypothetical protein ACIREE_15355 [Streptomyces sp. NPDC102467]|uniref:hypothetical protein n=1 Tax=Streptomyces sp. NPDC102467 TaxID=3366179 RepID=UPI0037F8602D
MSDSEAGRAGQEGQAGPSGSSEPSGGGAFGPPPAMPPPSGAAPDAPPLPGMPPVPAPPPAPAPAPPSMPVRPPEPPPGPADPARALAVGLLNLSGLGLGYVFLRRRLLAALCLAATAGLLVVALPADPDGVPGWALAGYAALLLIAAADGARRGLRARSTALRAKPVLLVALAVVLLAVPAGGAVAYGGLRDDAVEDMLLDRLAATDALVKNASADDFAQARPAYRTALARYRALTVDHPGSRAAHRVHDSLDTYYKTVAAPYTEKDRCGAVAPLEYLRDVPRSIARDILGDLAAWPDTPLAVSLLECGTGKLGTAGGDGRGGELGQLLRTFPKSAQAAEVTPAVRAAVDKRAGDLSGAQPCRATDELHRIGDTAKDLPAPAPARLRGDIEGAERDGAYACGMDQFKDGKFGDARKTLAEFAGTYKSDRRGSRARQVAIAAEIAEQRPAAGTQLPPAHAPGGTRMQMVISNDGPGPVEILYTGPVTGRVTIGGCGACSEYASEAAGSSKACKASGRTYPKKTLRLPAGTYHFLHKPGGSQATARSRAAGGSIRPGYTYTQCSYVVSSGLGADL